ncbi:MAG: DUF1298 domain-containing protein [Microthrixaceae bacterium]|nr:DUF1298 domain-containing protein [Microthrixaceae bacterium]
MPVLRRRVVPAPHNLGNPVLVDDPDFDIANHLRTVQAAPPGTQRQLDEVVADIAGVALPRDRPLWEMTVVTGLEGGRVGFVMKLHHALADGVASVALLENAFITDEAAAVVDSFRPEPIPDSRALYRAAASGASVAFKTVPRVVKRTAVGVRHARLARKTVTTPLPGPFAGPKTPFNVALTTDRTFAGLAVPLDVLITAKRTAGVTLNDTFLALCGGGIRRYLARMGELPDKSMVASVPMATRTDLHRLGKPRRQHLLAPRHRPGRPAPADPPHQRLLGGGGAHTQGSDPTCSVAIGSGARKLPRSPAQGLGCDRAGGPPPTSSERGGIVCPGPRTNLEIDGGQVTSLYSCGPILEGIGLNITAWSYVDTMYISVLGCSASSI